MDRRKIICALHMIVGERLFGSGPWPADAEICDALNRVLERLGIQEWVDTQKRISRATCLGKELAIDLQMTFMGLMEEWSAAYILETYGLIDKAESEYLYHLAEKGIDLHPLLRPRAQKAYIEYYNRSGLFH